MGHRLGPVDRVIGAGPGQTARRIYRVVGSSVRRFLNIRADTPANSPLGTAGSPAGEDVTSVQPAERSLPRDPARLDDAQVREWKGTWVKGAEGRWAGTSLLANPYRQGSLRAAAWRAGWHWADRQPDRRQAHPVR